MQRIFRTLQIILQPISTAVAFRSRCYFLLAACLLLNFACNVFVCLQIYLVAPESPCSDLAQYNFSSYAFINIDLVCTGVGQGYFLNFLASIVGGPQTFNPALGGTYACNKFRYSGNQVSSTRARGGVFAQFTQLFSLLCGCRYFLTPKLSTNS